MAKFLISPGVMTREVDNSQYAATVPGLGNIAALVGYAEKGPFEPTLVTGTQDFVEKFGKTIADAPYLAQAAYKYFEENDILLVTRAGNNQDPDAYPNAAQYSSIDVRLNPAATLATAGYQTFSTTEDVAPGTFSGGTDYGFKVLTDFRAFKAPKQVETWMGTSVETASSMGPSPLISTYNIVFKAAFTNPEDLTFDVNYKSLNSMDDVTEYQGTGTKTGMSYGNTLNVTLYKYRENDTYVDSDTSFISFSGVFGANVVGSTNLQSGYDFSTNTESFKITLGASQYEITLDSATADIDAVVAEINAKLAIADNGLGGTEDLSTTIQAVAMKQTPTESYIMLKKITAINDGFSLESGTVDALTVLGIQEGTYNDNEGMTGTWHAEDIIGGNPETFDGDFGFSLIKTEAAVLSFEEYINITIESPTSGDWQLSDIITKINAELAIAYDGSHTDDGLGYTHPQARGTASLNDNKITIVASDDASEDFSSITRIENPSSGNSILTLLGGVDQPEDGNSASSVGEAVYNIQASEKGSYGQKLMLRTETQNVTLGTQQVVYNNIYVLLDGYEVSTYPKVVWDDIDDPNFFITRMANDKYIKIEAIDEDEDATYAKLPDGDWMLGQSELPNGVDISQAEIVSFTIGTNGWTDVDGIITSMSSDFKNALAKLSNPEVYEFILVAAPGTADPIVQNAVQDLCNSRKDCFGVVDAAPFGIGLGIKEGVSDVTEVTSACSTVNSSYVGAFWPWLKDYDSDNSQYVWLPPSIYALKSMVYTDNVADPWNAPAGLTRGKVSAVDVEYSPSRTDRDLLYGDTNIVNPIVFFVSEGITIWGQKTGQRTQSATDRINVRRLLIHTEKLIAKMARGFLFEPNDSANWSAFTRQANAILEPIRQRRGFYQYSVVCDESTNTPDLINQNIMAGKIFVQPTKTTEFIQVEFTVNAAGEVTVNE